MLTGWPSELSSLSGGDGSCGVATLPRKLGFGGSELEELLPQAPRPTAAALAMAIAMGTRLGRIRTFISAQRPQSSVKTALRRFLGVRKQTTRRSGALLTSPAGTWHDRGRCSSSAPRT